MEWQNNHRDQSKIQPSENSFKEKKNGDEKKHDLFTLKSIQ